MFEYNLNNYTKTIPAPKNHTELVILLHIQIKFHKNYTSESTEGIKAPNRAPQKEITHTGYSLQGIF